MQLETFRKYPRYQVLAVLRNGELIGDFLSMCDKWAKKRPKHSERVVWAQNKAVVELSTIENP